MSKNYYAILGVDPRASDQDIRKAYRRLALKYHPDKNSDPGAEDKFKEIAEAYDTLSQAEKKQRYDLLGASSVPLRRHSQPEGANSHHFHTFGTTFHPVDPFEIFRSFFGSRDPFGPANATAAATAAGFNYGPFFNIFNDYNDPFHSGHFFTGTSLFDDSPFENGHKTRTTTYTMNNGAVKITKTVIGDDGKVRMETRFQSSQPPPAATSTSSRTTRYASPPKAPSPPKPDMFSLPKNAPKSTVNPQPADSSNHRRSERLAPNPDSSPRPSPKPQTSGSSLQDRGQPDGASSSPSANTFGIPSTANVRRRTTTPSNSGSSTPVNAAPTSSSNTRRRTGVGTSTPEDRDSMVSSSSRKDTFVPSYAVPTVSSIRRAGVGSSTPDDRDATVSSSTRNASSTPAQSPSVKVKRSSSRLMTGGQRPRSRAPTVQQVHQQTLIQCPLCGRQFQRSVIEVHASTCEGREVETSPESESDKDWVRVNLPEETRPSQEKDRLHSDVNHNVDGANSATMDGLVECPICNEKYTRNVIERHAASCGDEVYV